MLAQVKPLLLPKETVGRDEQCGLRLQEHLFPNTHENLRLDKTSRLHFVISRQAGMNHIVNKSMNGTYVNKTSLVQDKVYELRNKDVIAMLSPCLPLFTFLEEVSYCQNSTFPVEVPHYFHLFSCLLLKEF